MRARLTGEGGTVLSGPVRSGPVFRPKTKDQRPQTKDHSHQPSVVTGEYDEQAVVIASGQRIRCCRRSGLKTGGGGPPPPRLALKGWMLQTGDCDEPPEWS